MNDVRCGKIVRRYIDGHMVPVMEEVDESVMDFREVPETSEDDYIEEEVSDEIVHEAVEETVQEDQTQQAKKQKNVIPKQVRRGVLQRLLDKVIKKDEPKEEEPPRKLFKQRYHVDKKTFTKSAVKWLLILGCINGTMPFVLAAFSKEPVAEMGIAWVTEIVGVTLGYLLKSYFETKSQKRQRLEDFKAGLQEVCDESDTPDDDAVG